jgi:hypothetical protein
LGEEDDIDGIVTSIGFVVTTHGSDTPTNITSGHLRPKLGLILAISSRVIVRLHVMESSSSVVTPKKSKESKHALVNGGSDTNRSPPVLARIDRELVSGMFS